MPGDGLWLMAYGVDRAQVSSEHGASSWNLFQTSEVGSQMSDLWKKGDGLISDCE